MSIITNSQHNNKLKSRYSKLNVNNSNFMADNRDKMTELGLYLARKSISKAAVSKRTGISRSRLSELTLNTSTHLRALELYLIALSIDVDPCEMMKEIFKEVHLED